MDRMLREFNLNDELHRTAIQHSLDKKIKLSDVYTWFEPMTWDIVTNAIENGLYYPSIPFEDYRDKKTGDRISYNQAQKQIVNGKKVRKLAVLPVNDRICHNSIYKVLYDTFEKYIPDVCVSYRRKVGTPHIAKYVSSRLVAMGNYKGKKTDLESFFDSVPIEEIDKLLTWMRSIEDSALYDPIEYEYHDNRIEINGEVVEKYMSLRQGNPLGCLFADLILRNVDKEISENYDVLYLRYSDDIIIIGNEYEEAYSRFEEMLNEMGIKINQDKTETITSDDWFEFLGFSFKGDLRSVSSKTLRNLKHKIKTETISITRKNHRPCSEKELKRMIRKLQRYFFTAYAENQQNFGMGVYLFGGVNVEHDLMAIEDYCKDCLRAAYTNRSNIYGLGYVTKRKKNGVVYSPNYVIDNFNKGRNVRENFKKTMKGSEDDILRKCGWVSLMKMYNDYHTNYDLFEDSIYRMSKGL